MEVNYVDGAPWVVFRFLYRKRGGVVFIVGISAPALKQVPYHRYA